MEIITNKIPRMNMNYETECELTNGAQVIVDYEVVWDEDRHGESYWYAEVTNVWALLKDHEGSVDPVDVCPVLHWRDMEALTYHCEKHYARMVEEEKEN